MSDTEEREVEADETPTSGLEGMFKTLVEEMRSMNRKLDNFTEPVDLNDEDNDNEVDDPDNEAAEAESIVSLDTKVQRLSRAAGNKDGSKPNILHDIAQDLDLSEKTGNAVDEELAQIVNGLLKDKIPDEKTQTKVEQYPKPANIEGLRTPRVNPLIWNQLPAQVRTQDSKYQKTQNSLVASLVAITKATDIVLKQNKADNKELLTHLTDGIALAMNCLHDVNNTRRQSMKKDLHRDYAALCNTTKVPASSEHLFGDLSKLTKDIADANKLTKRVRPLSAHSTRGRKSTGQYYSNQSNRNRRFTPYAYSRTRNDNFLSKGRSPTTKGKKESTK